MTREPKYTIRKGPRPIYCVPYGLDTSSFIDITSISDSFRRYLDPETGRVHDCKEYYERMMAETQ